MISTHSVHIHDKDDVRVKMDALGYFEIIVTDPTHGRAWFYVKPEKLFSILDLCQTALTQRMKEAANVAAE